MKLFLPVIIILPLVTLNVDADQAAPSSHFNFGENITGDIQISEVRIPSDGITPSTYYETLGFRGNKGNNTGNGYGGIQESKDRRGNRVHIFSMWHALDNPKDKANFPYVVHLGHGMVSEHFGGEGVGLKTWKLTDDKNDPLYWKPDIWYTHVVRCWPEGDHTRYGFFVRDGSNGIWRHLSTIGVKEANILMTGPNDAFLEDWEGTGGNVRKMHLRNNWRRETNGKWAFAQAGKFAVNSWDLEEGRRSYNYRTNWNAGVSQDKSGKFYFMETGGNTKPGRPLSFPKNTTAIYKVRANAREPEYDPGIIKRLEYKKTENGELEVSWEIEDAALPQFSYELKIHRGFSEPSLYLNRIEPHTRTVTIDVKKLNLSKGVHDLSFTITDLFDNKTKTIRKKIEQ